MALGGMAAYKKNPTTRGGHRLDGSERIHVAAHPSKNVSFVDHLMGMIRRKVVLILDRWSVHRTAVTVWQKRYPNRLAIEWLPAYVTELNPAE